MKSKISLTIVLTASISFGIALAEDAKASNTQTQNIEDSEESSPIAQGEGKCASSKCGSLKKLWVVDIDVDEADSKLVRVRDGNCGTKVQGIGLRSEHQSILSTQKVTGIDFLKLSP
ncbi:MAG: hypothetical protein AB8V06_05995 [Francisella endosymbiont of Hyalomma asiaticum]